MSKPNGISRTRRRRTGRTGTEFVVPQTTTKANKTQLSDLFCDFDLSDITIDFNRNNTSFQSTKSLMNSESTEHSMTADNNVSKSFQSFQTSFKSINCDKNDTNFDKNDTNSGKKDSIIESKKPKTLSSFKSCNISETNGENSFNSFANQSNDKKRKSFSVSVFEDFDLTDLKFNESVNTFESARKVIKTAEKSNNNNKCNTQEMNDLIQCLDQSFGETECLEQSSPEDNVLPQVVNDCSFGSIGDQFFIDCIDQMEKPSESPKSVVKTDLNDNDIEFMLRSDFCTYNEVTTEEFCNDYKERNPFKGIETEICKDFTGFRSGNGKPLHVSETERSKAQLIFEDIEKCLLNEINENKEIYKNAESIAHTYSQTFVSNRLNSFQINSEKKTTNDPKVKSSSNSPLNSDMNQMDLLSTSYKFEPLKSCPRHLMNTSPAETFIPFTSTPKTSSFKRKIDFEPKKCQLFSDK